MRNRAAMAEADRDGASFRDYRGRVYSRNGRIYRTIADRAADDFDRVAASGLFEQLFASNALLPFARCEPDTSGLDQPGVRYIIEAPPLPFVSYPYEMVFSSPAAGGPAPSRYPSPGAGT